MKSLSSSCWCFLLDYAFLGCWTGKARKSTCQNFKDEQLIFGPIFKEFSIANAHVETCKNEAIRKGIELFVLTNSGCRGDVHTGLKFRRYGRSDSCKNFELSKNAGHVYGRGGKTIKNYSECFFSRKLAHFTYFSL